MAVVVQKSSSWKGFSNLEYLIIFGDSYSDVGYSPGESPPGEIEPLGVQYPGNTFADGANWVGFLATEYNQSTLVVFDFAKGGETTKHLRYHLEEEFLPHIGDKPEYAPWSARNSLFVTWIGINDMGSPEHEPDPPLGRVLELQERLYETGARNFMLIDLPPIHRCPGIPRSMEDDWKPRYVNWNAALRTSISEFASSHQGSTVFLFSSWDTFSRILDHPTTHGFRKSDTKQPESRIWIDHLHPTSAVHKVIAHDVANFLQSQEVI